MQLVVGDVVECTWEDPFYKGLIGIVTEIRNRGENYIVVSYTSVHSVTKKYDHWYCSSWIPVNKKVPKDLEYYYRYS